MKFIYTVILIASFYSIKITAQSNGKSAEVTIKTEVFCDHCNHCESCKPRVEIALFAAPGVKNVKLDIEAQTIHVVFNPKKINSEDIKKIILGTGYAADGVQPQAEDYAKLDGCCKRK